jgi:secreted trypsin-like serine protease
MKFNFLNFSFFLSLLISNFAFSQSTINTRVIGGGFANPSRNSSVMLISPDGNLCSGSVISKNSILTAAHCAFIGSRKGAIAVVRGRKYSLRGGRRASGGVDVGIIKVNGSISAPSYRTVSGLYAPTGQVFLIYGYGRPNSGKLTYGYMSVQSYTQDYADFVADPVSGSNACPGDSGGPALVTYNGRETVIGVVSRGPAGCSSGSSVVFASTTTPNMSRWIRLNSR